MRRFARWVRWCSRLPFSMGRGLSSHARIALLGVLIVVLVFYLSRWAHLSEQHNVSLLSTEAANLVQTEIEQGMRMRVLTISRMAARAKLFGSESEQRFAVEAQMYASDFPGLQVIAFVRPDLQVQWMVPEIGNEPLRSADLGSNERRREAFERARDEDKMVYLGRVGLIQGGRGFAHLIPVTWGGVFQGFLVDVYRYDVLMSELLRSSIAPGYNIRVYDGSEPVYARSVEEPLPNGPMEIRWTTAGPMWRLEVFPLPDLYARQKSFLDETILAVGLLITFLCLLLVNRVESLSSTQSKLRILNDDLERRVHERTQSLVSQQSRLRGLTSELATAEQRERRRIAGELHDYLAQQLVAVRLKLSNVRRLAGGDQQPELRQIDELLGNSLKYTRTLIADLYPVVLYESGISEAMRWLAGQMRQHGLEVHVSESGTAVTYGDDRAAVVFQAVRELLLNVVKHANTREAWVGVSWESGGVTISVEDRGIGTSMFQDNGGSENSFGLFNIQQRIESWGGTLSLESAVGRGTRASIFMPSEQEHDGKAAGQDSVQVRAVTGPPTTPSTASAEASHLRVLLVDDHDLIRHALCRMLESFENLEVIGEARDGEEAVAKALQLVPDVVLMDVNMPKINGIEATRRIKRALPQVRVIGLSVHQEEQLLSAMLVAGASAYITKGGPPEELYRAMTCAGEGAAAGVH